MELNLYDMNRAMYASVDPITDFTGAREMITKYLIGLSDNDYFMLLNNEKHYYTIFHWYDLSAENVTEEVIDIVTNLGPVKDIIENDNGAIEFWIDYNGEICVFVLFPYDQGVIEV